MLPNLLLSLLFVVVRVVFIAVYVVVSVVCCSCLLFLLLGNQPSKEKNYSFLSILSNLFLLYPTLQALYVHTRALETQTQVAPCYVQIFKN